MLMIMFARPIISILKWDPKSYYAFSAIAIAPIFVSIMCTFRGFFQGLQNVRPTAISQIVEQVGRVVAGVLFAYLLFPKGIEYAAGGAALGTLVGAVMGSIYLVLTYFKVKKELPVRKISKHKHILVDLGKAAFPISLGAAVGTIMSLIDSILVPQQLLKAGFTQTQSAVMYGQLTGKVFTLMNVPLALSVALCASLVPIIAEAFYLGRRGELIKRVDMAVKLSNVISLPSSLGMFFMAYPIMHLVFMKDAAGYEILKYISISIPFYNFNSNQHCNTPKYRQLYEACIQFGNRMHRKGYYNICISFIFICKYIWGSYRNYFRIYYKLLIKYEGFKEKSKYKNQHCGCFCKTSYCCYYNDNCSCI